MVDDNFLEARLDLRRQSGSYRELLISAPGIDFSSNDYLGIVKHRLLEKAHRSEGGEPDNFAHGSTGSRLLTGNSQLAMLVETEIARRHETEAALLLNSGYDANLAILSCVPGKGDTIIYDFLSHVSIRDGIKLSSAQSFPFLHNDLEDLERRLRAATGTIFVVTESVFSMDGDVAPLEQMVKLCSQFGAHLIVDEAHATGIAAADGAGVIQDLRLQESCFARVHTFGKALGCHGAAIVGSQRLINYLVNFARPLIYTTALPAASLKAIHDSYRIFPHMQHERLQLNRLIRLFASASLKFEKLESNTPIQGIIIPGNDQVREVSAKLARAGLDARPILYPTVPAGKERLRVVLHSFNTTDEVEQLIGMLS